MNRKIRLTLIAAASGTALVAAGFVPAAFADSSTPSPTPSPTKTAAPHKTLAEVQAAGATHTSDRISSLNKAIAKYTADKGLTASDKTTILGTLNTDLTEITALATKIAGDTTLTEAKADYKSIYATYRVYAVVLPQSRYAKDADTALGTTIPKLTAVQQRLSTRLSGKASAKSTAALQADLSDMTTQLAKATNAATGVSAAALAVTPAQFNSNHSVLDSAKQSVATIAAALKQARSDAASIRAALK